MNDYQGPGAEIIDYVQGEGELEALLATGLYGADEATASAEGARQYRVAQVHDALSQALKLKREELVDGVILSQQLETRMDLAAQGRTEVAYDIPYFTFLIPRFRGTIAAMEQQRREFRQQISALMPEESPNNVARALKQLERGFFITTGEWVGDRLKRSDLLEFHKDRGVTYRGGWPSVAEQKMLQDGIGPARSALILKLLAKVSSSQRLTSID